MLSSKQALSWVVEMCSAEPAPSALAVVSPSPAGDLELARVEVADGEHPVKTHRALAAEYDQMAASHQGPTSIVAYAQDGEECGRFSPRQLAKPRGNGAVSADSPEGMVLRHVNSVQSFSLRALDKALARDVQIDAYRERLVAQLIDDNERLRKENAELRGEADAMRKWRLDEEAKQREEEHRTENISHLLGLAESYLGRILAMREKHVAPWAEAVRSLFDNCTDEHLEMLQQILPEKDHPAFERALEWYKKDASDQAAAAGERH